MWQTKAHSHASLGLDHCCGKKSSQHRSASTFRFVQRNVQSFFPKPRVNLPLLHTTATPDRKDSQCYSYLSSCVYKSANKSFDIDQVKNTLVLPCISSFFQASASTRQCRRLVESYCSAFLAPTFRRSVPSRNMRTDGVPYTRCVGWNHTLCISACTSHTTLSRCTNKINKLVSCRVSYSAQNTGLWAATTESSRVVLFCCARSSTAVK